MMAALTNHLWQSTAFAALAGLTAAALRRNRAHVRYGVWFVASCKFLIPFSLLVSIGGHLAWPHSAMPSPIIAVPAVSAAVTALAQPFFVLPILQASSASAASMPLIPIVLVGAWLCGFVAIACIRLHAWMRIRAAVRASAPLAPDVAGDGRPDPRSTWSHRTRRRRLVATDSACPGRYHHALDAFAMGGGRGA